MAYPDLYSDESIVLNAQNIKVKSVSFEAVLTTRRLILVDSKKHLIAPQEILLATLRDIEVGENAIRDPTIMLSIITNTGATRQMILTFSKTSGGERKRECDEWARVLRQHTSSTFQHPIMPDITRQDEAAPAEPAEAAPPRREVTNVPAVPAPKKKIEIARPIKKIIETAPAMPKPVEVTTLPTGSFCNRCGNRVPPESAFCNKCGTPVVKESDLDAMAAAPVAEIPASTVPQVQVSSPPVFGNATERKDRPIEDVIHSIEPLIEDSVPRTVPAPLVPKHYASAQPAEETPVPEAPAPQEQPAPEQTSVSDIKWPVITPSTEAPVPTAAVAETPVPPTSVPPHYPVPEATSRKPRFLIAGVVAIVILVIIAAVFVFANPLGSGAGSTITTVTTSVATTATTIIPTPAATTSPPVTADTVQTTAAPVQTPPVPSQGVWVHVIYPGKYTGSVGTPGNLLDITGAGDQSYQIPTSEGIVVASVQKADGSSDSLTVEVFKNGKIVTEKSTVTPKGIVEVQADLKPAPTPTPSPTPTKAPIPVTTAAGVSNTTVNSSATATP